MGKNPDSAYSLQPKDGTADLVELPIDHFRLLGVSPSSAAETMLRTLQLRIDRPPSQGFTHDALQQRAELLRLSADLLTDQQRREDYEAALLNLGREHPGETAGLELSSSREVAGLMLLWEASAPHEAFQLARQALQPPQAPALGSSREADLALLASLSCRDASRQDQEARRYESAAGLLTEGLQLLQRVGKLPDQRQAIEQELLALTPYRILDLLSRDLAEETARQQGLQMLDQLVNERGGLEGARPSIDGEGLSQGEFELFFQQIRRFLTVQEQLDFYRSWQRSGSDDAAFLAVMALTASGFSRRKPERLDEARLLLAELHLEGLDLMPVQGCLDLLLGDVDRAQNRVTSTTDPDLQQWLLKHPGDDLAALCDYCRAWLRRDVLPGFRDVDTEAVDLEAWFADRDVQAFVERLERIEGRQRSQEAVADSGVGGFPAFPLDPDGALPLPVPEVGTPRADLEEVDTLRPWGTHLRERLASLPRPRWSVPSLSIPRPEWDRSVFPPLSRSVLIGSAAFAGVVVLVGVVSLVGLRRGAETAAEDPVSTEKQLPASPLPSTKAQLQPSPNQTPVPLVLQEDEPSLTQLQDLLQAWLNRKAIVLAGGSIQDARLADVAREGLLDQVQAERERDAASGTTQVVKASITSAELVSISANRIELRTQVAYSDQRLNAAGEVIDTTAAGMLPVTYVIGRDGKRWRLHAYVTR